MSQEGTFENESIARSTQTNHSLFRTSVYLFNVKKILQEGTFENESIACSTQKITLGFAQMLYLFNE